MINVIDIHKNKLIQSGNLVRNMNNLPIANIDRSSPPCLQNPEILTWVDEWEFNDEFGWQLPDQIANNGDKI